MLRRLLIRPGGIGDCILSLPALEFCAADYTEVWAPGAVTPLMHGSAWRCPTEHACGCRSLASTGLDLVGLPEVEAPEQTVASLTQFDSIFSWYGANRPEFRETVAGLGLPFEFFDALPRGQTGIHAADFFLWQVGGKGRAVPRIACPRSEGGFAAIHPFSGSARKNWPLERFQAVAQRLSIPVRWCAGPEEPLAEATRFGDLHELALWLASARLYIGNDSGITHLAAAVGTPVVAVFGPSDPAVWGPRGERVRVISGTAGWPEVDEVLATAMALLA
jgi:heptosyltransferase-3